MAHWEDGKGVSRHDGRQADYRSLRFGLEDPYRWKDSATCNAEIRIWVLGAIANGMRPSCSKFSGSLHDMSAGSRALKRFISGRRKINNTLHISGRLRGSDWFTRNRRPGITAMGTPKQRWRTALGWYQALVESRIPLEMVHDRLLDPAHLAPYATVVLPNLAALSDTQCDQLRAFVKNGGNLIATYETSLYDEWGVHRSNFGLADRFGVDWTRKAEGPMLNSYIRLEHVALPHHLPRSFPATLICLWKKYIHGRRRLTSLAFFFVKPRSRGVLSLGHRPDLLGGVMRRSPQAAAQRFFANV
jgi:hypothetical protein